MINKLLRTRNTVGAEYYNLKNELNEKKAKLFANPNGTPQFDTIMMKFTCVDKESESFKEINHKFLLPEVRKAHQVTKTARKLADYFAFTNNWIFEQILRFNYTRNLRSTTALEELNRTMSSINAQRCLIADQLGVHLSDIRKKQAYQSKTIPVF